MLILKPTLFRAIITQSPITVYGSFSFLNNSPYHSYATRDLSSKTPRAKHKRKTKTEKLKKEKTTNEIKLDNSSPEHYSLFERHAILKEKKGSPSYVFDDKIAAKIASKIIENQTNPSSPIIEYNPGPALLTRELFKLGATKIIGIESRKEFHPYLQNVQETFGADKFPFYKWDPLMANLDSRRMDKLHENEIKSFYHIKPKRWTDDPYASIVVILNTSRCQIFLHLLQILIGTKESLFGYGRPELFLLVPVKNYRMMMVKDPTQELWTYGRLTSIWNLFFDIETLLELHKSDVFPPFTGKRHLRVESKAFGTVNKDSIYLVRIIPKKNPDPIINYPEDYYKFSTFLTQITRNKSHRLIPKMESWLPGSGIHLIRMGFNMSQVTGDIFPYKYLEIYKTLKDLPEFKGSSLDAILSAQSTDNESRSSSSSGSNINKTTDPADPTDHLPPDLS